MSTKHWQLSSYAVFLVCLTLADINAANVQASLGSAVNRPNSNAVEFITVEELKSKITKKERVTIIDVRSSANYAGSDVKIKGAIRVKPTRLKGRLSVAPLKDVPRNSEVITYCGSPNDKSGVQAAEVLLASGFTRVRVLKGGWQEWLKVGGQVEARPKAP